MSTLALESPELSTLLREVFGADSDPMDAVERRAEALLPGLDAVVWEGDASTFQFSYVGKAVERVFGYPARRWTTEPTFWADVVVHADDRDHAVAFCAVATGQGRDHDFEYRALTADGRVVPVYDVVRVIKGRRDVPERLRGVMIDLTGRELPRVGW